MDKKLRNISIFLFFLIIFSILQFHVSGIIGFDGYWHIKAADLIKKEGFTIAFKWLPYSIYSDNYADLNFLFRVFLIPFTFGSLIFGAKLSTVLFSSLCFFVFYLFLMKNNVKLAFIWTVLYLISSVFLLSRFLYTRPMALSIIFLLGILYFLKNKKYLYLSISSFFYVWLYQGFIFGLVIIFIYFIIDIFFNRKINHKIISYPLIGTALALIINPYFPHNLYFTYLQLFKVNLIGNVFNYEWRAWNLIDFFKNNLILLFLFVFGIFLNIKNRKFNKEILFLFILSTIFLIFTITSKRMQEYFAPFVVLFFAFAFNSFLANFNFKKIKIIRIVVLLAVILVAIIQYPLLIKEINNYNFLDNNKEAVDWLKDNVPENSLIFNNGYTFNYLFFHAPEFQYTHGLDLTYSYLFDAEKFDRYSKILQGELSDDTDYIIEDYNPDYLFIGNVKQDENLRKYIIKHQKNYEIVYEDKFVGILKVKKE